MALNKKGQQIFVSIMIAIMALILIVILSGPLKEEVGKVGNSTTLNSSSPNLSVEDRATLIIWDMGIFYYIGIMVAASIAYVAGKKNITGAITAIMVFVVISVLISPLKSLIILARDSSHLNCEAAVYTVGSKLACIVLDVWLFYFAVTAMAVALSLIFVKEVLPKIKGE